MPTTPYQLPYNGATVHLHPSAYAIFWGAYWATSSGTQDSQIILKFFADVGSTAYENVLTQYYQSTPPGTIVNTNTLYGQWMDTATPPTDTTCYNQPTIEDSSIQAEVLHAISVNSWLTDPVNSTYFVYTPPNVNINDGQACDYLNFCAYHSIMVPGLAYAEIPYADLTGCATADSPNNDAEADAMVDSTAHEDFESITDPYGYSWIDQSTNNEIADLCRIYWNGDTTLNNGGVFSIQSMWSNASSSCVNSYNSPPRIGVNPSPLNVSVPVNGVPSAQGLTVQNTTWGTLNWSLGSLPSWIAANISSGSLGPGATQQITLTFSVTAPVTQSYTANLAIADPNADNSPYTEPVTLVPGNDNIGQAASIAALPYTGLENTSAATTAQTDPNLSCGQGTGSHTVWYQFTVPHTTKLAISTSGSGYDTVLGVSGGNQSLCNDDSGGQVTSLVTFIASAGTPYTIEVASKGTTPGGSLQLTVWSPFTTTGVFRPSNGALYLKNQNSTGYADLALYYGLPGDLPITGDWIGKGYKTIGIYRNGTFYLRNSNTTGYADIVIPFGAVGDIPVAGDWTGKGYDSIGVYQPSTSTFLLRDSNTSGPPDHIVTLGISGDVPIVGDWTGQGIDTVGVFRPSNGIVYLRNSNTSGYADIAFVYGIAGDKPVVGDWDGNGTDTIGVDRNGTLLLRNSNTTGPADLLFYLGIAGDDPIAGPWVFPSGSRPSYRPIRKSPSPRQG